MVNLNTTVFDEIKSNLSIIESHIIKIKILYQKLRLIESLSIEESDKKELTQIRSDFILKFNENFLNSEYPRLFSTNPALEVEIVENSMNAGGNNSIFVFYKRFIENFISPIIEKINLLIGTGNESDKLFNNLFLGESSNFFKGYEDYFFFLKDDLESLILTINKYLPSETSKIEPPKENAVLDKIRLNLIFWEQNFLIHIISYYEKYKKIEYLDNKDPWNSEPNNIYYVPPEKDEELRLESMDFTFNVKEYFSGHKEIIYDYTSYHSLRSEIMNNYLSIGNNSKILHNYYRSFIEEAEMIFNHIENIKKLEENILQSIFREFNSQEQRCEMYYITFDGNLLWLIDQIKLQTNNAIYLIRKYANIEIEPEGESITDKPTKKNENLTHKQQMILLDQLGFLFGDLFKNINADKKSMIISNLINRNDQDTRTYIRNWYGTNLPKKEECKTKENIEKVNKFLIENGLSDLVNNEKK